MNSKFAVFRMLGVIVSCFALSACLSSGSSSNKSTEVATNQPVVPDTSQPSTPTQPSTPSAGDELSCNVLKQIDVISAVDPSGQDASPAIDGLFMQKGYWSSEGKEQPLIIELAEMSLVKGVSIRWSNDESKTYYFDIDTSTDNEQWHSNIVTGYSDSQITKSQWYGLSDTPAKFIKFIGKGNNKDNQNSIVEIEAFGCANNTVADIELADWYLGVPVDENNDGKSDSIYEKDLTAGYFNADFFFTASDGGLVFRTPVDAPKTSTNTSYTRTELREMLRRGKTSISTQGVNENNWVFSTAPQNDLNDAGGIDGKLTATLAVNHVTTTGELSQVGRVIIGQIHANDDEPIRLYYRKLPNNTLGSIYFAHEPRFDDEQYYELIGTRSQSAPNPIDGIALNEVFSYTIEVTGNELKVTLIRKNKPDITQVVDMSQSGYTMGGQYMYFKAGIYNQNKSGDPDDYGKATFYQLVNEHQGY